MSNFEIGFEFVENEVAFVDRLQVGSDEAFETLIHLYQAPIYNVAYRILGDPSEASDAVQETFMKIFKGIKTFRGEIWSQDLDLPDCDLRKPEPPAVVETVAAPCSGFN